MTGRPILRKINRDYFEQIDTKEKAYWLGFIAADGCVRYSRGYPLLIVALATRDEGHLLKLVNALEYDGALSFQSGERFGGMRHDARFTTYDHKISEDLIRHGIVPRKTYSLRRWDGPEELLRHYWRGMVDGDGCLSSHQDYWTLSLCGTKDVVDGLREFANAHGIDGGGVSNSKSGTDYHWQTHFIGRKLPLAVSKLLYDDATVYLDRKMEIARMWASANLDSLFNPVCDKIGYDKIKELYEKNRSYREVAETVGINYGTIRSYCLTNGISTKFIRRTRSAPGADAA